LIVDVSIDTKDAIMMEELLRKRLLADTKVRPAIIAVAWFRNKHTVHKYLTEVAQWDAEWFTLCNFEKELNPTFVYYGIPVISFKNALFKLGLTKEDAVRTVFSSDLVHPNDLGHAFMGSAVIQTLWSEAPAASRRAFAGSADVAAIARDPWDALYAARDVATPSSYPVLNQGVDQLARPRLVLHAGAILRLAGVGHETGGEFLVDPACPWQINVGERSSTGRKRPIAIVAKHPDAALQFSVEVRGSFGVRYMQSYEKFGRLKLSWKCPDLGGWKILDGWHQDHSSLPVNERIEAGSGLCKIQLLTLPGLEASRSSFKIEYISV